MPKFSIRRKKRKEEPKPEPKVEPVEEKIDDQEEEYSSSEEKFINESLQKLSMQNKPQREQKHVHFEQNREPQYENRTNVANQYHRNCKFIPQGQYKPPQRNPYYRPTPSPYTQNNRSRAGAKGQMRFRSLYGQNGENLPTQTKAQMLYQQCFA